MSTKTARMPDGSKASLFMSSYADRCWQCQKRIKGRTKRWLWKGATLCSLECLVERHVGELRTEWLARNDLPDDWSGSVR